MHLLAFEGDPLLREIYQDVFSEVGARVTAHPPPGSLAMVQTLHPDLVLVDWPFPWQKPPPLLSVLQHEPTTAHLPVIVVTTAPETVRADLPHQETLRFLAKPFAVAELLAIADNLLEHSRDLIQRSQALRRSTQAVQRRLRSLDGQ